jgi:hypothetical protein
MKRNMNLRLAALPFALAGLALPMVGCDEANPLGAVCCDDFDVGADLSAVDWGIEGTANAKFSGFMQATADFAGVTTAVVNDIAAACQAMAVDMGAAEDAVQETDNAARATAWCNLAVTQIQAQVTAQGSVTINFQPISCEFSASAQANCEAKCTADVMCEAELGNIEARCDPGKLSGKCDAQCTGTCEGSANLAVSCDGQCNGTCEGQCNGMNANGSCSGTCSGTCRGSCAVDAMAMVQCEGNCTGGCSVQLRAPKCTAELTPPSANCQGSAECSGSCKASASAKAECRPPSVEIVATGMIDAKVIASLKLNLPKILLVTEARGKVLLDNATAVVSFSGGVVAEAPNLSAKAGFCVIPAAEAIATSLENLDASVSAGVSIKGALGM